MAVASIVANIESFQIYRTSCPNFIDFKEATNYSGPGLEIIEGFRGRQSRR